ncbi:glutaminyl-peptide cyclotransferase-like isoform X2 [Cimex lectularius]|uniref:glutaminyl-peptide cyclotransferase n=1 Tax=Cimex lectularius TaxID=79782 RepID=A0A8I6RJX0_CIMLE|nr:glutaminyl-peptide cyclotransferase-like isoform X2 [Cimex lectularius]
MAPIILSHLSLTFKGNRSYIGPRKNHFIQNEMKSLGWEIELDTFKERTPNLGLLEFTNIIAHKNANTTRRLVLACHYDSKYFRDIVFYGATDSAVPCAMLIHLAKVLNPYINSNEIGLSLVFFDGEEAFLNWSPTDSIYGARSLAAKWEATPFPHNSHTNHLHRIDLMVLLDLIGTKNQKFASYFRNTDIWHSLLAQIEKKIKALNISPTYTHNILERSTIRAIEDDHLPFLKRNVPILHLIPIEFPREWHTARDDYSCLHFPSIENMNKIMQVFVYSYIHGCQNKC